MKRNTKFLRIIVFLLFYLTFGVTKGQNFICHLEDSNSFASLVNLDDCAGSCAEGVDDEFLNEIPTLTIYVNFHYFLDANGEGNFPRPEDAAVGEVDGVEKANDLLFLMNELLDNFQQNAIGSANHIPHSKIKLESFTNLQNPNDAYGGIWFHNIPTNPVNNPFGVDEFSDIAEDQGSANLSAGNCFSNNTLVIESDFRNEAASINYFFNNSCIPFDVSSGVNTVSGGANTCPSGIPGDEKGKLSATEKQNLQQGFNQSNDAITQTHQANKLIRDYLIDEENYDWASARTWLTNKGGLEAHFMIVDSWLYEGNTVNVKNALNNIPNQTNFVEISSIAASGDLYAAWQAKGLVNSAVENTYIPTLLLPGSNAQQSIAPNSGVNNNSATDLSSTLMAAPNPTNSITVFTYQLPEELENGTIEIRNLQGQLIEAIQLNGNIGSINWNAGRLANGVYLYSLLAKNKVIANQRLVITK